MFIQFGTYEEEASHGKLQWLVLFKAFGTVSEQEFFFLITFQPVNGR